MIHSVTSDFEEKLHFFILSVFSILKFFQNLPIEQRMSSNSSLFKQFVKTAPSICVNTDLEPDDMIFIILLLSALKDETNRIVFVVSAWEKQQPKASFLLEFIKTHFESMMPRITIVLGLPSHTRYEMECSFDSFDCDFRSYVPDDFNHVVVFQLTHPSEIRLILQTHPDFFQKTYLFTYGSFNYRALVDRGDTTEENIGEMFGHFKFVFYYEAFPVTGGRKIESATVDRVITKKYPLLASHIRWWNGLVYDQCKEENHRPEVDSKSKSRNQEIIDSIDRHPTQFVDADCGLIATILLIGDANPEVYSGRYVYPKGGYPHFVDVHQGLPSNTAEVCHIRTTDPLHHYTLHLELYNNL